MVTQPFLKIMHVCAQIGIFFHFRGNLCPGYMEDTEIKIQWHSKAVLWFQ